MSEAKEDLEDAGDKMKSGAKKQEIKLKMLAKMQKTR